MPPAAQSGATEHGPPANGKRRFRALVLVALLLWSGCGGDTSDPPPDLPAATPGRDAPSGEREAVTTWRAFILPKAKSDAKALGLTLMKFQPRVGKLRSYGAADKQASATARVETRAPTGITDRLIYYGELRSDGGRWRVLPGSLTERRP